MSTIFGEGGLRVEYGAGVVDLPYSYGELSWVDELVEIKAINGVVARFYDGSRAKIKVTLNNVLEDSAVVLQLMHLLNSARLSQEPVTVYPRYNGAASRGYLCHVPVEFAPERLGLVASGQKVNLNFEGMMRYYGLPVYDESSQASVFWTTHTGDLILTETGVKLEFWA